MAAVTYSPGTALEHFLEEHGSAAPYHPEFFQKIAKEELLVIGEKVRLENGHLGISLELAKNHSRPVAMIYTSMPALLKALETTGRRSLPWAQVPGGDLMAMTAGKTALVINQGLGHPVLVEFSGGDFARGF